MSSRDDTCPGRARRTQRWTKRALPWGRPSRKAGGQGWDLESWELGKGLPGREHRPWEGEGKKEERSFHRSHPLAAPTSRGANTQNRGSGRGREARGLCSYPPVPKSRQRPPNSWWATAGLGQESGGAHRVRGGRDHGEPRPRGPCPCRVPAVSRPQWAAATPPRHPQLNHTGAPRQCIWFSKHRPCLQIKQSTAPAAGPCEGAGATAAGPGGRPPRRWRGPGREGAFQLGPGPPPPGDEGAPSACHICRLHTRHAGGKCHGGGYAQTSPGEVAMERGRQEKAQRERQAEVRQGGLQKK